METKTFNIQAQRYMLTYKTHINKELATEFFKKLRKDVEVHIAHETADEENPYEHTHILVLFKNRFQSKNVRIFDISEIHPNIKVVKTAKHLDNCYAYLCKEDHSNDHLIQRLNKTPIAAKIEEVWDAKTVQEAVLLADSMNEILGILQLYGIRKRPEIKLPFETPKVWQANLIEELKGPINDRKIIWMVDKLGGCGKTALMKYYKIKFGALILNQFGGGYHVGTVIKNAFDKGTWDGRVCFINLSRSCEDKGPSLYEVLEMIKDGFITVLKYQGDADLMWNPPHVVVFANWEPDTSLLSHDRWDIRHLDNDIFVSLNEDKAGLNIKKIDPLVTEDNIEPIKIEDLQKYF